MSPINELELKKQSSNQANKNMPPSGKEMGCNWSKIDEIQIFREYLQIASVQPDVDYEPCVKFLQRQARNLKLPFTVYYPGGPTKPIAIITWRGTEPNLPSIFLNSHMDVVPVVAENWTYPPFAAHMDAEGRIFARGAQDMKCVGTQYLAAIRGLQEMDVKLKRTIHVVFVPDEEIGGVLGMKAFVKTKEFKNLNVGFALDEGRASPTNIFNLFYGERTVWQMKFRFRGTTGHGSQLFENTAAEKLIELAAKFMEFRKEQLERLQNNPDLNNGDVTSVNLTILRGGDTINIVPETMCASFDCRVAVDQPMDELEEKIKNWIQEYGGGNIETFDLQKNPFIPPTCMDENNIYWVALKQALTVDLGLQIRPQIHTGGTDIRHIREIGIPSFGFSPMDNTPYLAHGNDEHLSASTYLKGIEIYKSILLKIGNV